MTRTRYPVEPPRTFLPLSRRDQALLGVSATTFLALCLWMGPEGACWLIGFAAFIGVWVAACRRWPFFAYLTGLFLVSFLGGFIMGLLGVRGGGYYYSSYRRYR